MKLILRAARDSHGRWTAEVEGVPGTRFEAASRAEALWHARRAAFRALRERSARDGVEPGDVSFVDGEIQDRLERLVGLPLSRASRSGAMSIFHFGPLREHVDARGRRAMVGDLALHVSCAWRLDARGGPVTGSDDRWEPADPECSGPGPDRTPGATHQDRELARVMRSRGPEPGPHDNEDPKRLVVNSVQAGESGDAALFLRGGFRLSLFATAAVREAWRLFRPGDPVHFVVEGALWVGDQG